MRQVEDLFQDLLNQLEEGDSLAEVGQGLPENEVTLLGLTQMLNKLSFPAEDDAVIAQQEMAFLEAAQARFNPPSPPPAAEPSQLWILFETVKSWLRQHGTQPQWQFTGVVLASILFMFAFFALRSPAAENGENGMVEAPIALEEVAAADAAVPSGDSSSTTERTTLIEEPDEESAAEGADANLEPPPTQAGVAEPVQANLPESAGLTLIEPSPSGNGEDTLFMPLIGITAENNPTTAAINSVVGLVEVQQQDGKWTSIAANGTLEVGQRVRTGPFSSAKLTFFDGSAADISSNSEISIDQLNAQKPDQGYRTVVMTQWVGESEHHVEFRNDGGSRYEVKSPGGTGIARGTTFKVLVTPAKKVRYIVTEGKVDVTGSGLLVSIIGGQQTSFTEGQTPVPATFYIQGRGEVEATGSTWTIAGQNFATDDQTLIIGNPQIGDIVRVEGRLNEDGGRIANRIILERSAVTNRFELSGEVDAIGPDWVIAGQTISVDDETAVGDDIAVGDTVAASGRILPDGTFIATKIRKEISGIGDPFSFSGVVQGQSADAWLISNNIIHLAEETAIDEGIEVGDTVSVEGWILDDLKWVAIRIKAEDEVIAPFEIQGPVDQRDPWVVSGVGFAVDEWTTIDPDIAAGDRVVVRGVTLEDGTLLAESISRIDDLPLTIQFTGIVTGIDPWIINGQTVEVTPSTLLIGTILPGDRVSVQAIILPDGRLEAVQILLTTPPSGNGCFTLSSPILVANGNSIKIKHWPQAIVANERITFSQNFKLDDMVTINICNGWDDTVIILGEVTLIYRPIVIIIDDGNNIQSVPPGCKLTGIGNGKLKLKCSDKSTKKSSKKSS